MPAGLATRCLTFRDIFVGTPTSSLYAMAFVGTRRPTDTSIQMPLAAYQHLTAEATQYAARLSESAVNTVLGQLLRSGELPTLGAVEVLLQLSETPPLEDVHIDEVELTAYDHLLDGEEEVVQC